MTLYNLTEKGRLSPAAACHTLFEAEPSLGTGDARVRVLDVSEREDQPGQLGAAAEVEVDQLVRGSH